MAYVITTGNPNTATAAQLTAWFSASRENTVPPIGTGLTPVVGDTASFTWTAGAGQPNATLTYNGSIWIPVTGQVINGNVIITGTIAGNAIIANTVTATQIATGTITSAQIAAGTITANNIAAGTITANQISASYLYTGNIVSLNANIANANSAGYWLSYISGNARFGGNVSIGNQLRVGNNAQIGGNLSVTGLVTSGNLNANTVATTTIQPQAVSIGNSLSTTTVQTLAAVPIKTQFYFSTPNVNITTTQVNEAVYVWASMFANVTGSTSVAPSSVALATRLSRFNSGGGGEVQIAGSIFTGIATTPGSFNLGDQFVYLGYLDTIATPGTYIYRLGAAVDSSGGSTTFTNLQAADRTLLVQTLKR
jgi:cytoskeletal protein CcmA (bactofilin family)